MKFTRSFFIVLLTVICTTLSHQVCAEEQQINNLSPKEIYGNPESEIKIKITNRTAGRTGLLRSLAEDYLKTNNKKYAIAWYNSPNSEALILLKNGLVDIALTYEDSLLGKAEDEGWTSNRTLIFHDHFVIVGPKSNPASLENTDPLNLALKKIYYYGDSEGIPIFLSREDSSATNNREKILWKTTGINPWEQENIWYQKLQLSQKEALFRADQNNLYILTDRATYLSNKEQLPNLKLYISSGKMLISPCFAILGEESSKESLVFLEYLRGDRAQNLISEFGKDKFGGNALFTPANQAEF